MAIDVFRTLSKSDFKAACDCPAKLYFREKGYPNTNDADEYLRMLAEGGYMVEAVAKLMYPSGLVLDYSGDAASNARVTNEALQAENVTLFEATLLSGRKLARADILEKNGDTFRLIEVKAKSFDSAEHAARISEGKGNAFRQKKRPFAIASDWKEYLADVAFQVLVLKEMFPKATVEPYLCLVDKARRTKIDGLPKWFHIERGINRAGTRSVHRVRYDGDVESLCADQLVMSVNVTAEVEKLMEEVGLNAREFEASIFPELRKLPAPARLDCGKCEYRVPQGVEPNGFAECWVGKNVVTPSVLDLYHASKVPGKAGALLDEMIAAGRTSLLDIPDEALVKKDGSVGPIATRQRIQLDCTRSQTIWKGDSLSAALSSVNYPLHFIDFEASRLALPAHSKMRPYGLIAFQWSCHSLAAPGAEFVHTEWLNDRDYWPNADFARSLRDHIGESGTVLTWSPFEGSTLKEVSRELTVFGEEGQSLSEWIEALTTGGRILDMNRLALDGYFHPGMAGRTSIKVVLDAIWKTDCDVRVRFEELAGTKADASIDPYSSLPPIVINDVQQSVEEGTGAIRAYQEMMFGVNRDDAGSRAKWRQLLLQYCKLDTLAMVLIWDHWGREVGK